MYEMMDDHEILPGTKLLFPNYYMKFNNDFFVKALRLKMENKLSYSFVTLELWVIYYALFSTAVIN